MSAESVMGMHGISEDLVLFGNRFFPVTEGVSFVAGGVGDVVAGCELWRFDVTRFSVQARFVDEGVEGVLGGLEPLDGLTTVLVQTANPLWTAVFTNDEFGGGQSTTAGLMSERLRLDRVDTSLGFASENPVTGRGVLAGWSFSYTIPALERGGGAHVQVSDQGNKRVRWQFDHSAGYMPFEDVEGYGARRIVERFSPAMVVEYCRRVGIELVDEGFYCGPVCVVRYEYLDLPERVRDASYPSYAQAQERVGAKVF